MRSIFISIQDNSRLRQLVEETGFTRNHLIRAAIRSKLIEWNTNPDILQIDLANELENRYGKTNPQEAVNIPEPSTS